MSSLLGGQIGLDDFIFAHKKVNFDCSCFDLIIFVIFSCKKRKQNLLLQQKKQAQLSPIYKYSDYRTGPVIINMPVMCKYNDHYRAIYKHNDQYRAIYKYNDQHRAGPRRLRSQSLKTPWGLPSPTTGPATPSSSGSRRGALSTASRTLRFLNYLFL